MLDLLLIPISLVIMLLILVAPLIFIYLFLRLSETAFQMVGFSHWHATLAVFGSILGSIVDLQLFATPISSYPSWYVSLMGLFSLDAAAKFHPLILAINLGGCIIPLLISAHLIIRHQVKLSRALIGLAVVAIITYDAATVILGADLMSLMTPGILPALSPMELHRTKPLVLSIGGAGIFDGIFLTGIIAVLLAAGIVCLFRGSCKGVR